MKKYAFFLIGTLLIGLSSCCGIWRHECEDYGYYYATTLPVEVLASDTVIDTNEVIRIRVLTSSFESQYQEEGFDYINFNLQATWFNGNFSSDATNKIDLISSNVGSLDLNGYQTYSGSLPNIIEIELAFPIAGYYMLTFNGNVSKEIDYKKSRCGCLDGSNTAYFEFATTPGNYQYFDLYNTSSSYSQELSYLERSGSYFIKVE